MNEKTAAKLADIAANPQNHHHPYEGLRRCCTVDGVLDTVLLDAHQQYAPVGTNGGVRCDSTDGPCSCGAWH